MSYTYGTEEWEKAYQKVLEERSSAGAPPYIVGTPEWVDAYEKNIQSDPSYKNKAATWEGSVVIHILPDKDIPHFKEMYMFLDLWHGDCRSIRIIPAEAGEAGDFVLTGDYKVWKALMSGKQDVIKALMLRKVRIKGDLKVILRYVPAATRLMDLVAGTEKKYPDEISPEEIKILEAWNQLRPEFGI